MSEADVCLILEGTYPYVSGGVSSWVHDLIQVQSHLNFHILCILSPDAKRVRKFDVPSNVIGITHVVLQDMPRGSAKMSPRERTELFQNIEVPLLNLQYSAKLSDLELLLNALNNSKTPLGSEILLNSEESWNMLLRMYRSSIGEGSFLNFFWSWRGLIAGMYSILLTDVPRAKVYHALCTGYAGFYLAKAHIETGRPAIITEHGIYTNERRIEITAAQWLNDQKAMNLHLIRPRYERDLKDYWIDTFSSYSKLAYGVCSEIITLYEGNTHFQIEDGADPDKIRIIPNGIEVEKFESIKRKEGGKPTVALIGRVVAIKDIKTFIRSVEHLAKKLPDLEALIMGPTDEDEEYYEECIDLIEKFNLSDVITFTGKVDLKKGLESVDVVVLTSISEAQPLVVLEAGAAGIPCVTTDVGSCRELLYGMSDENPILGEGGVVCPLSNSLSIADACYDLLTNDEFYASCSQALKTRVNRYYHRKDQTKAYKDIYDYHINEVNCGRDRVCS